MSLAYPTSPATIQRSNVAEPFNAKKNGEKYEALSNRSRTSKTSKRNSATVPTAGTPNMAAWRRKQCSSKLKVGWSMNGQCFLLLLVGVDFRQKSSYLPKYRQPYSASIVWDIFSP